MEKLFMHAHACACMPNVCAWGCSGKRARLRAIVYPCVPMRAIPCICAPVNTNLPLITRGFCPYVLFAGLTLIKRPGDVTKG